MTTTAPPDRDLGRLVLPALVLLVGAGLVLGGFDLDLPLNIGYLGPQWFPIGVGGALLVLGVLLLFDRPTPDTETGPEWRSFGIVVATLAAHVVLLWLVGWIPAGIALFWGIARAVGSTRALFDLGVAAVFSCAVQFGFSAGLGVSLPVGLLLEAS
ncbi:tripartite tricarboxylate transporter TctB family protein [Saccharopolyspora sp. ID03-671]|uniref:tripartite tricarboxylate transporter TctB family protein n=1 Tax=Saccharopolyspora sp. ID03-671 TaxID=3073066 RepID=UPI00324D2F5C